MSKSETGDDGTYSGEGLSHIAFPMGGMGAGMICLDGTGSLSHVSIRNRPEILNQPYVYAAVCVKADTNVARVLEGPVPTRKLFGPPGSGSGAMDTTFGLPRFSSASFKARFPFATVALRDDSVGLEVEITG